MSKYIIMVLIVLFAAALCLYLWERNMVVKQAGQISALQVENAGLIGQVQAAQANIAAIKKLNAAQQKVANDAAKLLAEIANSKSKIIVGGSDAKIFCDIADYFNAGGVLQPVSSGSSKAGRQVLPGAGASGNCGAVWTIEQIEQMALALAKYSISWEQVGACYAVPQ
jgi:hypothetical protein